MPIDNTPFDLSGKLAVVTGASRGIGLAVAEGLARAGADIIGVGTQIDADDSPAAQAVRAHGRSFEAISADFSDREQVRRLGDELAARERAVDILINNAGAIHRTPAELMDEDDWDRIIEIDLNAQFVLTRRVGARMLQDGRGKVVFTASLLSHQGGLNVAGYTSAKSGIAGLTRALANEWASRNVNVNAVVPGFIATDNTAALRADPARNQGIIDRIPVGRWGKAEDLAGAYVFLSSSAADYVHGAILPVDGGWLAR